MIKFKNRKHKYLNGTKGVISLFLACLLVPFTTLACALLTAARINSAVAIFDEALCNASNSTLGTYDSFLRKRFGLLSMEQSTSGKSNADGSSYSIDDLINETFQKYLEENLKTLSNTYLTSEANATGVYPLADTDVLLAQVLEYSKYSVPTKLVIDGLDIDDIIGYIDSILKKPFAIVDIFSSIVGSFGSVIDFCDSYQSLQDAVSNEKTAKSSYTTKWLLFASAAYDYKEKYEEMQRKLGEQQSIIDTESAKVEPERSAMNEAQSSYNKSSKKLDAYSDLIQRLKDLQNGKTVSPSDREFLSNLYTRYNYSLSQDTYDSYCADLADSITRLEKLKEQEKTNNSSLNSAYNQAASAYSTSNSKITAAQQEKNRIQSQYTAELEKLKTDADKKKGEYISAIETFQDKLNSTRDSLNKAQGALSSATSKLVSTAGTVASSVYTIREENQKAQINEVQGKIDEMEAGPHNSDNYVESLEALYLQKAELENSHDSHKDNNTDKYAKSISEGFSKGFETIKIGEKDVNIATYDKKWEQLESVKRTVQSVSEYKNKLPSGCYEKIDQPITEEDAKGMWKSFLGKLFSGALWKTIDTFKTIIETLFSFEGVIDGALNALVDTGYFPSGLPSKHNTKSAVNQKDSDASAAWKGLLGSYSSIGGSSSGTGDIVNALGSLSGSLDSATGINKGNEDQKPKETKKFLETCRDLFKSIFDSIGNAVDSLKTIFTQSHFYQKMLVGGYYVYMTQNRITYTGNNLSGNSFNLRGQPTSSASTGLVSSQVNSLAGLFGDISSMTTVKSRCFFGAETEYLFGKSLNELENQKKTFGLIFIIRLVLDVFSLFLSPDFLDLMSALAPTIIGPVLVAIFYIIIEPYLDSLILVNGGQIPIFKWKGPFLTSTGIEYFIRCIKSCTRGKLLAKSDTLKNKMTSAFSSADVSTENDISKVGPTSSLTDSFNPFYIDYLEQLLILTACYPQEDILDCLSDIIQMEGSENQIHRGGNDKTFDLTEAYTYVRVEASFTTQEFIKLTDSGMFNSTDRVMYRGY